MKHGISAKHCYWLIPANVWFVLSLFALLPPLYAEQARSPVDRLNQLEKLNQETSFEKFLRSWGRRLGRNPGPWCRCSPGPLFGTVDARSEMAKSLTLAGKHPAASLDYSAQIGVTPDGTLFLTSVHSADAFQKKTFWKTEDAGPVFFIDLQYRDTPSQNFYGPGGQSTVTDHTDFRLRQVSCDVALAYRFGRSLRLDLRGGMFEPDAFPSTEGRFSGVDEIFDETSAPGLNQRSVFRRFRSSLFIDYRDRPNDPSRGAAISITLAHYDDGRDRFKFDRMELDAQQYVPLASPKHLLAVRFLSSISKTPAGRQVPFYLQETLGGSRMLRGFSESRFRDRNLTYLSAEYRFRPKSRLELALFCDAGKVSSNGSYPGFDHLERAYGAGIRLKRTNGTVLRLDGAGSREGFQLYFNIGPSF